MTDPIHPTTPGEPDLTADLAAIGWWAEPVAVPDTRDLDARSIRYEEHDPSGPTWQRLVLAAAAVVLVVAGVWAFTRSDRQSPAQPTPTVTDSTVPGVPGDGEWIETSVSPLQPRNQAQAVWNGTEVIVFAGTDQPQCPTCDYFAYGNTLHDAAAYTPATDTWRTIAPLPDDASYVGVSARVGSDVYWMSVKDPSTNATGWTGTLYRYVSSGDTWEQVQVPTEVPLPLGLAAWGKQLVAYSVSSIAGEFPMQVLEPGSGTWRAVDLPFRGADDRRILEVQDSLYLFAYSSVRAETQVARLVHGAPTWTERTSAPGARTPVAAIDGLAVAPYSSGPGLNGSAYDALTDMWGYLSDEDTADVVGIVGVDGAWFGGTSGSVVRLDNGGANVLPPLPADVAQVQGAAVTAASYDLFMFGGNLTGLLPGELTNRALLWRSGPVETPAVPGSTVPGITAPPSALPDLQPSGACGAVAFYAIDTEATASVEVYLDLGGTVTDRRFATTAEAGSRGLVITLRRGANLGEAICNDVISTLRVDSEAHAVSGSVVIELQPKPGTEADSDSVCGNTTGTAEVTNLVFDDGTVIDRLSLGGGGVNCFAG